MSSAMPLSSSFDGSYIYMDATELQPLLEKRHGGPRRPLFVLAFARFACELASRYPQPFICHLLTHNIGVAPSDVGRALAVLVRLGSGQLGHGLIIGCAGRYRLARVSCWQYADFQGCDRAHACTVHSLSRLLSRVSSMRATAGLLVRTIAAT